MRGRAFAGAAGLLLLAGCAKAPPEHLAGTFRIATSGRVISFSSLAQKPSEREAAQELSMEVTGSFVADAKKEALRVENVQAFRIRSGRRELLSPSPKTWNLRRVSDGFECDRELIGEELWTSKVIISYWSGRFPTAGEREELELDGRNRIRCDKRNGSIERTWLSREADRADLPDMPNRESIPVEAEVQGSLLYSGSESFPTRIEGRKTTESRMGSRVVGKNVLEIRIDQSASPAPAYSILTRIRYGLVEDSRSGQNEIDLQRKTLGKATLEELLEKAGRPLATKARNQVFLALRALFYLQPGSCAKAVGKAKDPLSRNLVAEALAGVGSPSAQAALMPLLRSGEEFANRVALLAPLTHLEPGLETALLEWAFGSGLAPADRDIAQLVVGSNVRRCLEANPEQARRLSQRLAEALRRATTDDDRLNLLYALGNAGNPAFRDLQLGFLENPSPVLRKGAVHSLRFLIDGPMAARLKARLQTEEDPQVRREIEDVLAALAG